MNRIPVAPSQSPQRRRAYEQRTQLNKIIIELFDSWHNRTDDPLAVEILRGLALAQSLDDAHPINRKGYCTRWRCTRRWLLNRRQCHTRITLGFCRTADTTALWFHVLSQRLKSPITLESVRTWLTPRHTSKPDTDEAKTQTAPGAVE